MEVVEGYNAYDWALVVYVHEIPYYIHQSDAIVRCILEAASEGAPAPQRARVAVFVIREIVRQVMEPLPSFDAPPGDVVDAQGGDAVDAQTGGAIDAQGADAVGTGGDDAVDPGRLGPVNYYRLTVSELQFDERGIACLVEIPGAGATIPGAAVEGADVGVSVGVPGDERFEGRDGWRHALRATFPRVKARRRMLVSFSHGAAFGINVDMEGLMRVKACEELPILWSNDLATELKNCLDGQPIDVLLLNNCYMQCFETGYALKDQVRFIVAAEGALEAMGYDYTGLMKRLFEQPGGDREGSGGDNHQAPGDAVGALVEGIIGDYAATRSCEGQAVFANRTGEYGRLLVLLKRLIAILLERMDEVIDVLADIRENKLLYVSAPLNGYTANYLCMIDLFAWVGMVFDRLGHLFVGTGLPADFAALKQRMVVAGKVGEGLVEHDAGWPGADANGRGGTSATPVYGYSGLSIFYPRSADWRTLRPIPRCARLVDPWKRFLEAYYTRSPLGADARSSLGLDARSPLGAGQGQRQAPEAGQEPRPEPEPAIKNPGLSQGPGKRC